MKHNSQISREKFLKAVTTFAFGTIIGLKPFSRVEANASFARMYMENCAIFFNTLFALDCYQRIFGFDLNRKAVQITGPSHDGKSPIQISFSEDKIEFKKFSANQGFITKGYVKEKTLYSKNSTSQPKEIEWYSNGRFETKKKMTAGYITESKMVGNIQVFHKNGMNLNVPKFISWSENYKNIRFEGNRGRGLIKSARMENNVLEVTKTTFRGGSVIVIS